MLAVLAALFDLELLFEGSFSGRTMPVLVLGHTGSYLLSAATSVPRTGDYQMRRYGLTWRARRKLCSRSASIRSSLTGLPCLLGVSTYSNQVVSKESFITVLHVLKISKTTERAVQLKRILGFGAAR